MKKTYILIVDDDETDRYLLKRLLKKGGINYPVFEAENGQTALDFITNGTENLNKYSITPPSLLIFLDINMPIMDGFEFLEKFNALTTKENKFKSVNAIMVTSSERKEDMNHVKPYNFVNGFVTKGTLTAETLRETLILKVPDIVFED